MNAPIPGVSSCDHLLVKVSKRRRQDTRVVDFFSPVLYPYADALPALKARGVGKYPVSRVLFTRIGSRSSMFRIRNHSLTLIRLFAAMVVLLISAPALAQTEGQRHITFS